MIYSDQPSERDIAPLKTIDIMIHEVKGEGLAFVIFVLSRNRSPKSNHII